MGVTAACEISLWKTDTAETDVQPNLRTLQNLTLPADVIRFSILKLHQSGGA